MFLLRARRPEVYDRIGGTMQPVRMTEIEAKAEVVRRIALLTDATAREDAGDADGSV